MEEKKVHERKCPYYMLHRYCAVCSRNTGDPWTRCNCRFLYFLSKQQRTEECRADEAHFARPTRDEMIASFLPSPAIPTQSEPPRRIRDVEKLTKETRTWRSGTKEKFFLKNCIVMPSSSSPSSEAFNLKTLFASFHRAIPFTPRKKRPLSFRVHALYSPKSEMA